VKETEPSADPVEAARDLRVSMKFLRDLGSAQIVGGATVFLTLLLADLSMRWETFTAFEVVYFTLAAASRAFATSAALKRGARPHKYWRWVNNATVAAIILVGTFVGSRDWPVRAESVAWWFIVGLSLVIALVGLIQRAAAEFRLDEIAEARLAGGAVSQFAGVTPEND
jgi:hypothetical protein